MPRFKPRKPKAKPPLTHEQWIDIKRVNGETVTAYYPGNEAFEVERLEMDPQPALIYRRFNFVNGVPWEYMWTEPTPSVEQWGGHFLQRMRIDDWLEVLEKERDLKHKVAICCSRPVPRPVEWGPCPCERCTKDREELAAAS